VSSCVSTVIRAARCRCGSTSGSMRPWCPAASPR